MAVGVRRRIMASVGVCGVRRVRRVGSLMVATEPVHARRRWRRFGQGGRGRAGVGE